MTKLSICEILTLILTVILCAMSIAGFYLLYRETVKIWEDRNE